MMPRMKHVLKSCHPERGASERSDKAQVEGPLFPLLLSCRCREFYSCTRSKRAA